jgi:hypothetical protein
MPLDNMEQSREGDGVVSQTQEHIDRRASVFPVVAASAASPSSAPGSAARGVPSLGSTRASAPPTCDTSNMPPLMAEVVFSLRNVVGFYDGGWGGRGC